MNVAHPDDSSAGRPGEAGSRAGRAVGVEPIRRLEPAALAG